MGGWMGGQEGWRKTGGWEVGEDGEHGEMDVGMGGWADGRMRVRMGGWVGGVEVISVFVGHRRRGEWGSLAGRPGGAALRGSLAAQICADACADVGCIDCRLVAQTCADACADRGLH